MCFAAARYRGHAESLRNPLWRRLNLSPNERGIASTALSPHLITDDSSRCFYFLNLQA
jgi:hypothetical protein